MFQKPDIVNKYVDIPGLDELYEGCYTTKNTDKVMALWNIVTLGLWLLYTKEKSEPRVRQ